MMAAPPTSPWAVLLAFSLSAWTGGACCLVITGTLPVFMTLTSDLLVLEFPVLEFPVEDTLVVDTLVLDALVLDVSVPDILVLDASVLRSGMTDYMVLT